MDFKEFEKISGMKPPERIGCFLASGIFCIFLLIGIAIISKNISGGKVLLLIVVSFILTLIVVTIAEKIQDKNPKYIAEKEKFLKAYKEYEDEIKQKRQATIDKYSIPEKEVYKPTIINYLNAKPQIETLKNNRELMIWFNNNSLYIIHKDLVNDEGGFIIPVQSIKSFLRQGDMYIETKISGGGGGGSSIAGAVVGDLIAGPAGAVIGSRKKVDPIKTENKVVDTRQTILEFEYNSTLYYMFFDSKAYDIFLHFIPNKEMAFVNSKKTNNLDKYEEIRELSKLKDEGMLTDDEFNAKKKQILGI